MTEPPVDNPPDPGLSTQHSVTLGAMESPRRRSPLRLALQIVGALVGVGLAWWAVSMALGEQNADSLASLREASLWSLAGLIGLTFAHVTLNGLLFWVSLRPIAGAPSITPGRVIAVNSIPTLLAILPFKLGFVVRVALHHRLDGVSFKHLAAWMGAFAGLTLACLVPAGGAGLIVDGVVWWVLFFVGPALGLLALALVAHAAKRVGRLHRLMLGAEGVLTDPRALIATYGLRLVDLGVQGGRFALAAAIAGVHLSPDQALLLASSYFLIVALAPAGALGVAEMGTAGVAALVGLDEGALALVALVVSASHYGGTLLMALPACLVVRPDRALTGGLPTQRAGDPPLQSDA